MTYEMDNMKCDVSNNFSVINSKRTTLNQIKDKFAVEKVYFEVNMRMLEVLSTDYDSKLEKRNPLNEQAFLRISDDLQELGSYLKATGPNLSLIEQEIHVMETIIDSSTDSSMMLFLDHAELVLNILKAVVSKNTQGVKTIKDLFKKFIVISES